MQLGIDSRSAETISRAFFADPAMVVDELETAMGNSLSYLDREAKERTPKATGLLRQAWIGDVQVLYGAVIGTLSNPLPYAVPVELGTRPHMPPIGPILDWVEHKLNLYGDEAEQRAAAIQWKIAHYGTPGYGMARLALLHGRETVADEFQAAAERIVRRLGGGAAGAGA